MENTNNVRIPGGAYTDKIMSFSNLKVGDVVAVLNSKYAENGIKYYFGKITDTEPRIIFKDPPTKKFGQSGMTEGTTFAIEKDDTLLTNSPPETVYVRIYRNPVASKAAQNAALKAQEAAATQGQNAPVVGAAPNATTTAPVGGGRTKRKRRKRTRKHKTNRRGRK